MKKLIIALIFLTGITSFATAQNYTTGIGLRGGLANGITVKHFTSESVAIEGILSTRWRGFNVTGLYEKHAQAFDVAGLNWYYGFGGHIGFWDGNNAGWADTGDDYTVIGIDGILGIEYTISEIPINIGLDWKPALNVIGHTGFWADGGALSVRYVF